MILDYLTSLKTWRIVRPDFLDHLVERHREDPSSYLGYPIWSYAMLSAWLDSHGRSAMLPDMAPRLLDRRINQ